MEVGGVGTGYDTNLAKEIQKENSKDSPAKELLLYVMKMRNRACSYKCSKRA